MEPIIICQDLKLGFGANILVEHLSFTIEKGSYLCIVGENGPVLWSLSDHALPPACV